MRSIVGITGLALLAAACLPSGSGARNAAMGSFHATGVVAKADPTIRPARLLPETIDDAAMTYGSETDGGTRVIAAGLRLVTSPKGVLVASDERFPQPPTSTIALPQRLGGGFLYLIGKNVWRSEQWLDSAKPIFSSAQSIQAIVPGLDRVYIRAPHAVSAIDGRTGKALDLGPWPASPHLTSYGAADGWRAAAVADLRGVIATFDAGATWRTLDVPMDPKQVVVANDSLAIGGFENGDVETWYELRADGSLARLGSAPRDLNRKQPFSLLDGATPLGARSASSRAPTPAASVKVDDTSVVDSDQDDGAAKILGKRPLATAIEDGWPLADGTAVVARDGALARVSLSGGSIVELVRDAFPLRSARCHPVPLTHGSANAKNNGAFGFVCGEPRGATVLYFYEPSRGRLVEMKRFDRPRVVTSSGNGFVAIHGPCAEDGEPIPQRRPDPAKLEPLPLKDAKADDDVEPYKPRSPPEAAAAGKSPTPATNESRPAAPEIHPYCILGPDDTWREIHVRGDADNERVVVLADGRVVVLSPPQTPEAPTRLTVLDKGRATTSPVTFPRVTKDVERVLRLGLWLDGFEERRPGVIGGWIEAGGVMLGVEIALDGRATPGQYVRDAGSPFVSGKYGLGWTASRRGYETTDGGMTWASIDLPDPLVPTAKVERRACGPIGCVANGWLRVGWGTTKPAPVPTFPPPPGITNVSPSLPQLQLACEPLAGLPPSPAPPPRPRPTPPVATLPPSSRLNMPFGSPPVLGNVNGVRELQPFLAQAAPVLHESERGLNIDIGELVYHLPKVGTLGRIYGWGPSTGDWDTLGHWQVKWLSPFGGWPETRASLPSLPPSLIVELTNSSSTPYYWRASRSSFTLAPGDDTAHALLVGRGGARPDGTLFELEADRAPLEVKRADGEPFGELDGVVRAAGRWFVTTSGGPATSPMTVVWQIEGGIARELVRIPRALDATQASAMGHAHLARRSDNRAIGLVVDGEQTAERASSVRWVVPIALENGTIGDPEPLGYGDLAGRTLEACRTDDAAGWVLDTAMPGSTIRVRLPHGSGSMGSVLARLRLTSTRACIEELAGSYEGGVADRRSELVRPGATPVRGASLRPGELNVTAMSMLTRFPLKCSVTK